MNVKLKRKKWLLMQQDSDMFSGVTVVQDRKMRIDHLTNLLTVNGTSQKIISCQQSTLPVFRSQNFVGDRVKETSAPTQTELLLRKSQEVGFSIGSILQNKTAMQR